MKIKTSTIVCWSIGAFLMIAGASLMLIGVKMRDNEAVASVSEIGEFTDVSSISVSVPECNFTLSVDETAERCTVSLDGFVKNPSMEMNGNTLVIEQKMPFSVHFIDFGWMKRDVGTLHMTVPEKDYHQIVLQLGFTPNASINGLSTGDLDVEFGAGEWKISDLEIEGDFALQFGAGEFCMESVLIGGDLDADFGAGNVILNQITCGSLMDLDFGVGDIACDTLQSHRMDFDMGIGDLNVNALSFESDLEIDQGIGDAELALTGKEEQYGFNCDLGLGSMLVNGKSVSNTRGEYEVTANGGIGSITITTAE